MKLRSSSIPVKIQVRNPILLQRFRAALSRFSAVIGPRVFALASRYGVTTATQKGFVNVVTLLLKSTAVIEAE